MAKYWIKLYHETINDPKIHRMQDWVFRRMIEFFLLAGMNDEDGLLQPVEDIAFHLRLSEDQVEEGLRALSKVGVTTLTDRGWVVTNFSKRQAPVSSTERVRQFRKRKGNETFHDETLHSNSVSVSDSFSSSETAQAIRNFEDPLPLRCLQLYQQVTGQTAIPPSQQKETDQSLVAILDQYGDREPDIAHGKRVFTRWCNTKGKQGMNYSKVNTGWLAWWLDEIAPMPQENQADSMMRRLARDLGGKT